MDTNLSVFLEFIVQSISCLNCSKSCNVTDLPVDAGTTAEASLTGLLFACRSETLVVVVGTFALLLFFSKDSTRLNTSSIFLFVVDTVVAGILRVAVLPLAALVVVTVSEIFSERLLPTVPETLELDSKILLLVPPVRMKASI